MLRNFVLSLGICCATLGCSHFVETRAIEHFAKALESGSLDELKATTSAEFEQKALRLEKAIDDLKILRLPTGEVTIVEVEDVSETQKKVTVEVGETEPKRRLQYLLARDEESGKWAVDDVQMTQTRENLTVAMSVTKQMDLLLSVREFTATWAEGDRNEILESVTPEFGRVLDKLPPRYLARLTHDVIGDEKDAKPKPPSMDEAAAVVRIPRSGGHIVLAMKLHDGRWKASDVALETRDEAKAIKSLKKTAHALDAAVSFLTAYGAEDLATLEKVSTRKFYADSLAHADLQSVPLPGAELPPEDYQLNMQEGIAEFRVPTESEVINLRMERQGGDVDADTPTEYRIAEVTVFELDGTQQEKRLSAMFTSQAMMLVFADALAKRDLSLLKKTSSTDFNRRIWDQLDERSISAMPLESFDGSVPRVMSTVFNGAVVEITAVQGEQALTYVLRDWGGAAKIDDVLLPANNRPSSLKTTLEYMLPVQRMAGGLELADLGTLQRNSSGDFNRLIWEQVAGLPALAAKVPQYLHFPLKSIEIKGANALVTLGGDEAGAKIMLVTEHKKLVVDEILLVDGPGESQRTLVRNTIRQQMADGSERTGTKRAFASAASPVAKVASAIEETPADEFAATAPEPDSEPEVTDFASQLEPEADAFASEEPAEVAIPVEDVVPAEFTEPAP